MVPFSAKNSVLFHWVVKKNSLKSIMAGSLSDPKLFPAFSHHLNQECMGKRTLHYSDNIFQSCLVFHLSGTTVTQPRWIDCEKGLGGQLLFEDA